MTTNEPTGKTPQDNLDLAKIMRLVGEGHATIRHHGAEIINLSSAITDIDAAMRLTIAERSIDEQQSLVVAARRLAVLLDGSEAAR